MSSAAVSRSEQPPAVQPELLELAGVLGLTGATSPETFDDAGQYPGQTAWQDRAACTQVDPEIFFPLKGQSNRRAKNVCGSFAVKSECLEYALNRDEPYGIWGGMTEKERRRLKPATR